MIGQTIFIVSKSCVAPGVIPALDSLIRERVIVEQTPTGYRAVEAGAPPKKKHEKYPLYMGHHYAFFESRPAALAFIAAAAEAAARELEAMARDMARFTQELNGRLKAEAALCDS